jgi:hypothetical protein
VVNILLGTVRCFCSAVADTVGQIISVRSSSTRVVVFINVFETSTQITITQRQVGWTSGPYRTTKLFGPKMLRLAAVLYCLPGRLQRSAGRSRISPHHVNFKQDAKTCPLCPRNPLIFFFFNSKRCIRLFLFHWQHNILHLLISCSSTSCNSLGFLPPSMCYSGIYMTP